MLGFDPEMAVTRAACAETEVALSTALVPALTVITIGTMNSLREGAYRIRSAQRLMEIVLSLDKYLRAGRLYIP
jgi:hypothetical protein